MNVSAQKFLEKYVIINTIKSFTVVSKISLLDNFEVVKSINVNRVVVVDLFLVIPCCSGIKKVFSVPKT